MKAREFLAMYDDRISQIVTTAASDPERAHKLEDYLTFAALTAISEDGDKTSAEIATRALAITGLNFKRWYA